mgnify:CR=1 FL=1
MEDEEEDVMGPSSSNPREQIKDRRPVQRNPTNLTEDQRREIARLKKTHGSAEVAELFGISQRYVQQVVAL